MNTRAWAVLLFGSLTATAWLLLLALQQGATQARVRSANGIESTETAASGALALEGDPTQTAKDDTAAATPEQQVRAVEGLEGATVVPGDERDPGDGHRTPAQVVERLAPGDSEWVDRPLSALSSASRANAVPLAERDGKDARREEQLEKLRQRECATILDHIRAGLAWLALHQAPDGHFSEVASAARCRELGHHPRCTKAPDLPSGTVSTTGLALMALVGHRDQDETGLFEPGLAAAARWLSRQQRADGSFSFDRDDYSYSNAIALVALGDAAASSGDPDVRAAVERGMAHLASHPVRAVVRRDLSTVAYVAQAVEAARRAGVTVPPSLEAELRAYLESVWEGDHRFRQSGGVRQEQPALYPVGMLARSILWKRCDAAVTDKWRGWLVSRPAEFRPSPYSLYYGVRMTITLEGTLPEPWRAWLFDVAGEQVKQGPAAGSVPNLLGGWWMGPTTRAPTFQTAAVVLTLEEALH